jgi:hypothetical protein
MGALVLGAQVAAIVHARFTESRYFCWAPYDAISRYELAVEAGGRALTDGEIRQRYRLPGHGRDNRAIQHVKDVVAAYERTYGRGDGARVRLRYRTNGGAPHEWRWPADPS